MAAFNWQSFSNAFTAFKHISNRHPRRFARIALCKRPDFRRDITTRKRKSDEPIAPRNPRFLCEWTCAI
jgi:hypothetical protein